MSCKKAQNPQMRIVSEQVPLPELFFLRFLGFFVANNF